MKTLYRVGALVAAAGVLCGWTSPLETVLHEFRGGSDGRNPTVGLIENNGILYGTTPFGGNSDNGTFFKLGPITGESKWAESVLYRFTDGQIAGDQFRSPLIVDDSGAFYGTTYSGAVGAQPNGSVYELTPPKGRNTAWKTSALYKFCSLPACADGNVPLAGLIIDRQGALYGTTSAGGEFGAGTVFKLNPPQKGGTAWTETVLYSFRGGSDGTAPTAPLTADKHGALYGTTAGGGNDGNQGFGNGTVFKLTPPGTGQANWTKTVLYRFTGGSDGAEPTLGALIIDDKGALYGTTEAGGNSSVITQGGTVFKLTPAAEGGVNWKETILHRFCSLPSCSDGAGPWAGLIADKAGALYGTTQFGGNSASATLPFGPGTIFKLTPPTERGALWLETVLYRFKGNGDGAEPVGGLIAAGDALYGTTYYGGLPYDPYFTPSLGTVFKLTLCAEPRRRDEFETKDGGDHRDECPSFPTLR